MVTGLTLVLLTTLGCQDPAPTLAPAVNPSGWSLAVVQWGDDGRVGVRLKNNTNSTVTVYEPHELFNLSAEAPAPLKGVGHTITKDIAHSELRLVRPGGALGARFDLRSRVSTGDGNGRYPCRVVYDDTKERAANGRNVAKLGRIESEPFWVIVRRGSVVKVEWQ